MTGATTQGIQTVLHPVSDVDAAKTVYTALLGLPPQTDSPYYVGFETAGDEGGVLSCHTRTDHDDLAPLDAGCSSE